MEPAHLLPSVDREQLYRVSADIRRVADMMVQIAPSPREITADFVRSIIRARRLREKYLGSDLFADPAWDMLLDLFAAQLERRQVSVSSLCLAAAVPPTTALRWISILEAKGILLRQSDSRDARRVWLRISDEMTAKLTEFFAAARSAAPLLM
jgi:hypothetical protein